MNKSSPVSLALLAALLLAGSAVAQTISSPNPSGADANRADRHCVSTTLSADASAPCSGDVLNDRPGELPLVVRSIPGNSTPGTVTTSTGTQSNTGTASTTSNTVNMGAGSTGSSVDTTGMPSTGPVNSVTSSTPGATGTPSTRTVNSGTSSTAGGMGTGAASATGAAGAPARR